MVPLTGKTIGHLRVYLTEFHPGAARLPATRPLFYSLHHGQPAALQQTRSPPCSARPRNLRARTVRRFPATSTATCCADQGHGPLPARHPAPGHHAAARPRERIHHLSFYAFATLDMMRQAISKATPAISTPVTDPLTEDQLQALYSLR